MYFGLPGPLWTSLEANKIMAGDKKNARRGYINVTCFKKLKRPKNIVLHIVFFDFNCFHLLGSLFGWLVLLPSHVVIKR